MPLFDFFRKKRREPPGGVPLEQSCYDIAYFILPKYVFHRIDRLVEQCQQPNVAGPFFYLMACQSRECEPDVEVARKFQWLTGDFDETRKYLLLSYPEPPPVDMGNSDPIAMLLAGKKFILAPHFSLILYGGGDPSYYILGQAPIGGGTTLRQIIDGGTNCNLGPGPPPTVDALFERVRKHDARSETEAG